MKNLDNFLDLKKDHHASQIVAEQIFEENGFIPDCERINSGTQLVFVSADKLILKLFDPTDAVFCENEAVFLNGIYGKLSIQTPELFSSGWWNNSPFLIMQQVEGTSLDQIWSDLVDIDRSKIMAQLGYHIRDLHSLDTGDFPVVGTNWNELISAQRLNLLENHRLYGLSEIWVAQLEHYFNSVNFENQTSTNAPLHTELMPEHIFVKKSANGWYVSGLIDFEPAMLGAPEYEFASVGLFLSRGNRPLLRNFLNAYGYKDAELSRTFSQRVMGWMLLHRFSNLNWFMQMLPDNQFSTLEDLEKFWFGV